MTHFENQRWVATPNPDVTRAVLALVGDPKFVSRFRSKVDTRNGPDGDDCDIWTGALSSEGYGNFTVGAHTVRAHRVAYMIAFGEVPNDLFLDHVWPICRYRICYNEWHLEPVNNQENTRRGIGIGASYQRAARSAALLNREAWGEIAA